tara:strand:+ start:416 stop:700 length:285 start_codon:yes stop_codon:yes gene_type:complete
MSYKKQEYRNLLDQASDSYRFSSNAPSLENMQDKYSKNPIPKLGPVDEMYKTNKGITIYHGVLAYMQKNPLARATENYQSDGSLQADDFVKKMG